MPLLLLAACSSEGGRSSGPEAGMGGRSVVAGAHGTSGNGGVSGGGGTAGAVSRGGGGASGSAGRASRGGAGPTDSGGASDGGASDGGATASGSSPGGSVNAGGANGGGANAGGASDGGAGTSGEASNCKRGIAANVAPGAAFFPGVTWWYNWAIRAPSGAADSGIEFVPMIWDEATAGDDIPANSSFLLGFNEPNFFAQANLSAEQAASRWQDVEASARAAGVPIVSPGMNFCGPEDQCHGTNPYRYLEDFFAACSDCQVDYVAVHWYNCDLPSLRAIRAPALAHRVLV
jgi:hypothetical protein